MKNNLTSFLISCCTVLLVFATSTLFAQNPCYPPAAGAPVFATADVNAGPTHSFTSVPVGSVIQLVTNGPGDVFNINLCGTNADGWADGDHDSSVHILDSNTDQASGAAYLLNIEDGCTNGAGPNFWGPDTGSWATADAAGGTFFMYITEWNAAGNANCEVTSGQTYDIEINIVTAGPCSLGTLTTPTTQSVCALEAFEIEFDTDPVSDGGFTLTWDNANTGGTGGTTTVPFSWAGFGEFPISLNSSLNGALNDPFVGTWEFTVEALDATGAICDQSPVVTVTFLDSADPACTDCTGITSGNITSAAQTVCPAQNFEVALDGTQASDYGFYLGWDNTNTGGTGSTNGPFTQFGIFQAEDFPISYDSDLNGVLSANSLPPFEGTWEFTIFSLNAGGTACNQTATSVSVTFLPATDPTCADCTIVEAGTLTSPTTQATCPSTFTISLDGTQSAFGGYQLRFDNANTTGTGGNGGLLTLIGLGDSDIPFTYDNDLNGVLSANNLPLYSGEWEVTVFALNGNGDICDSTAVTTVNFAGVDLMLSATSTEETCQDASGTATVSATGGSAYTYLWSNGMTTGAISGLSEGTYTVTVTDASGCDASTSVDVTNLTSATALTVSLSAMNESCGAADGSATVDMTTGGSGSYSYAWDGGETTASISGLAAAVYTVTVTDMTTGCSGTGTISVDNDILTDALMVTTSSTGENCGSLDGTATVDATTGGSGNYSYAWINGEITASVSGLAAGTYPVTVTDMMTGCSGVGSANVGSAGGPNVTIDNVMDVSCNGGSDGSIMITVSGGATPYTYVWSNSAITEDVSDLAAGDYTGTVTDDNGCSFVVNATVGSPTAIAITLDNTTDASCNDATDGGIMISVSGGTAPYTYVWSNGATNEDISDLAAGDYTGTVTDDNGCTATATASVGAPDAITVAVDGTTNATCNAGSDGSIMITVAGGTAPYTYAWSNGLLTEDLSSLSAGDYMGTITDANGCEFVAGPVTITEPDAITVTVDGVVDATGSDDGEIMITVAGGTAPYTYAWSNGETTEDLANLAPADYTGTITDANGCTLEATVTVGGFALDVDNINGVSSFSLSPNPTTGDVRITMSLNNQYDVALEVFDIAGRSILSDRKSNSTDVIFNLDLTNYPNGVYFARFIVDGQTFTERIIKSN